MIVTLDTKSPDPEQDGALLFVHFEIHETPNPAYGVLSVVLRTMSALPSKLVSVEVSAFSSHLRVMAGLSLSPSTTATAAIEVMRGLARSIETACKPCRIEAMQGVLAPDLLTFQSLVNSHQN